MTKPHENRDKYDDLSRQDEAMSPEEFSFEQVREPDMGSWPEVAGVIFTVFVLWLSFSFKG